MPADNDFDGDGKPDILLRNYSTGQNLIFLLDGTAIKDYQWLVDLGSDWKPAASGDFSGDGVNDIVWHNASTSEVLIWLMQSNQPGPGQATYIPSMGAGWRIGGAGDFDGDGKPDLIWYNPSTGQNLIWLMDGTNFKSGVWLVDSEPGLRLAAIADFDLDGHLDVLWQDPADGNLMLWLLDGQAIPKEVAFWPGKGADWVVAGAGDFNGDDMQELLWRNAATGETSAWLLHGLGFLEDVSMGVLGDSTWTTAGDK
jgi:hypothetical protein